MLIQNYSLKNLNTLAVDVNTKFFTEIFSVDELQHYFLDNSIKQEKKLILGGGSNILFTKDFEGLIIKISIPGINVIDENSDSVLVEAGAGVIWDDLVKFCVEKNYGGIENLTLIPGTVGAAPVQNIGAYGQELTDTFYSLEGFYIDGREKKTFKKGECGFSYRSSIFKEKLKNEFIITTIKLKLTKNPKLNNSYKSLIEYLERTGVETHAIIDIRKAVAEIRKSKLPDPIKIGNAGSFFKNPEIDFEYLEVLKSQYPDLKSFPYKSDKLKISAGWLIEKCGWKGKRAGDVGTAPDHALVICNFGKATGAEILEFAMRIKEEVANKFGITLKEEVNIF